LSKRHRPNYFAFSVNHALLEKLPTSRQTGISRPLRVSQFRSDRAVH